jgi:hypothetical protein
MRPFVYFRFTPDQFHASVPGTAIEHVSSPEVAYDLITNRVLAIGPEAPRQTGAHVALGNGFRSERMVINDIDLGEVAFRVTLAEVLQQFRSSRLLRLPLLRPKLLIHPVNRSAEELTSFEIQGLVDLGVRSGAHKTWVYFGPALSDRSLLIGHFTAARESGPRGSAT